MPAWIAVLGFIISWVGLVLTCEFFQRRAARRERGLD